MTFGSGHIRDMHSNPGLAPGGELHCNWQVMRQQLLQQWALLTEADLVMTGPNPRRIAMLIERKYGISSRMIENYLQNFVRTMPLQ